MLLPILPTLSHSPLCFSKVSFISQTPEAFQNKSRIRSRKGPARIMLQSDSKHFYASNETPASCMQGCPSFLLHPLVQMTSKPPPWAYCTIVTADFLPLSLCHASTGLRTELVCYGGSKGCLLPLWMTSPRTRFLISLPTPSYVLPRPQPTKHQKRCELEGWRIHPDP